MTEGYGLHAAALEELAAQGVRCVVTVDCGTSSVEVAANRPAGMALVVTDHHLPLAPDGSPPRLAPADALVNPKQPADTYGFDGLAGAGVAWKLLCALESEGIVPAGQADAFIGLAALGTIADMMPLRGENRTIVRRGLGRILDLPGLRALAQAAAVSAPLGASDVAFGLAPRINAAGRMEDARLALDLCLSDDPDACAGLARHLDQQNRSRQEAVAAALAEAEERVAELPDETPAIVIGDPGWPMGSWVWWPAGSWSAMRSPPSWSVSTRARPRVPAAPCPGCTSSELSTTPPPPCSATAATPRRQASA